MFSMRIRIGGLESGWFVIVTNFAPQFLWKNSCGKVLDWKFSNAKIYDKRYMQPRVSELKKLLL